jgi:di/tricarboxylate transporter
LAIIIAIAASCEFSTPIGYQTNLMVMGPGGYRWRDYTRFGGPLTILIGIVCVLLTPLVYPLS